MALEGLPVTVTDGGLAVTPTNEGLPVTLVGGTGVYIADGDALEVTVSGSYTDTVTFTIVDGEITEIVLS